MTYRGNSHFEPGSGMADGYFGAIDAGAASRDTQDKLCDEIAIISHELRNSLAVIRNATQLLRPATTGHSISSARALIERHVGHMGRHIEKLLDPQRRGMRSHGLNCSRIDLRTIARYAADAIGPEMARRGHRLAVQLPEDPVWVHADGACLEQVFWNLLINAAKYTPEGGDIALTMEGEHDGVRVRIRDSGAGIEPAMLQRVFGMFVQAGATLPEREGGRGIGLAVVRNSVEQHGGTVTATSPGLGLGSEFVVVLPTLWAQQDPVIVTT